MIAAFFKAFKKENDIKRLHGGMGLFPLKSTEGREESGAVNMSKVSVILLHKQ